MTEQNDQAPYKGDPSHPANREAMQQAPTDPMLQFFAFEHLPDHLRSASIPFWELACHIVATLPRNPERTVGLRKLLEAKDCCVRARLFK